MKLIPILTLLFFALRVGVDRVVFTGPPTIPKPAILDDDNWLAIVGDSSVTGAAAHPDFTASWTGLLRHTFNLVFWSDLRQHLSPRIEDYTSPESFHITPPISRLTRVLYSHADREDAKKYDFEQQQYWEGKASTRVDTEEYSFGYLLGRRFGIPAEHIINVGQDGTTIDTMAEQFERILDVAPTLPPLTLISYVANDLCDPDIFSDSVASYVEQYRLDFRDQLREFREFPTHPRGSQIVILAPLDIANILANPDVLAQKVDLAGIPTTCGEFREAPIAATEPARLLQDILIHECSAVLDPSVPRAVRLAKVTALQKAQVRTMEEELLEFNATAPKGMRVSLATSVRHIQFHAGDLANDCFHPALGGHERIALQLLNHELKTWDRAR